MKAVPQPEHVAALTQKIEALQASGAQAQEVEGALRGDRLALARHCASLAPPEAQALHATAWGECHRLLVHGGLRNLPREAAEEAFARDIAVRLDARAPQPGLLLAAMLMLQAFELAPLPRLEDVPDWLLQDYARFLLAEPRVLERAGDADRYQRFMREAVAGFHRCVLQRPTPAAQALRHAFVCDARFLQLYFNEENLRDIYRQRAEILESLLLDQGAPLAHLEPLAPRPPGDRRLRVGVLCMHWLPQTDTYFMLAHLERLPRERFSLVLYSFRQADAPLERYAASIADAMVVLAPAELGASVARVRQDRLDALVVGNNITVASNDLAFLACFRLAPVQVISASSPVTSGLTSADWYLSAEYNETEEGAREHHTEAVYRMPGMLTRYAYHLDTDPGTLRPTRAELGVPEGAVVFFSAANFFKVVPELSALWARLLAAVPGAWLVLMPFNPNWSDRYLADPFVARVLRDVDEAGGDVGRVIVLDRVPTRADLHALMANADVYLDSHPFAGACSLLDPLLVGLPVVARRGRTFRGSVGAGMLRGLGLADMSVDGAEAYLERAVMLARDPAARASEAARIRAAITPRNPVFDSETGSRNFAAAIQDMVERAYASDAALLDLPPAVLRERVEELAERLSRSRNRWFAALTDLELIRQLIVPYFGSVSPPLERPLAVDVGACVGQTAKPFLALGWEADLFEPDPACAQALEALAARYGGRARVHRVAASDEERGAVTYYQRATGLSGIAASPYAAQESAIEVPAVRLGEFMARRGVARVDFLKIDAEGWDFRVLGGYDLPALPPRLVMVEFSSDFPAQSGAELDRQLAAMAAAGYDALVFSYDDHGNFRRQVWKYDLIAARFGRAAARADGQAAGNILFYRRNDVLFLATVLRMLRGFLPARERPSG